MIEEAKELADRLRAEAEIEDKYADFWHHEILLEAAKMIDSLIERISHGPS